MTYTNGILVACNNQSLEVSCAFYDILQALCVAKLFNVLGIGQNKHQHYLDKTLACKFIKVASTHSSSLNRYHNTACIH